MADLSTLYAPTSADVINVRKLAREIAKAHGTNIHVRKTRDGIVLSSDPHLPRVQARIELLEALIDRGFENYLVEIFPDSTKLTGLLDLSREWEHPHVSICIRRTTPAE